MSAFACVRHRCVRHSRVRQHCVRQHCVRRRLAPPSARRSGSLLLEVLIAVPLLLMGLLAVIELGLILAHVKHVDHAAATAARLAAGWPAATFQQGDALPQVRQQVDAVLAAAGLGPACRVDLEHNLPGGGSPAQSDGACPRPAPTGANLPAAGDLRAVRVTVWIDLSTLAPDLLAGFGLSLEDRVTGGQAVLPHLAP